MPVSPPLSPCQPAAGAAVSHRSSPRPCRRGRAGDGGAGGAVLGMVVPEGLCWGWQCRGAVPGMAVPEGPCWGWRCRRGCAGDGGAGGAVPGMAVPEGPCWDGGAGGAVPGMAVPGGPRKQPAGPALGGKRAVPRKPVNETPKAPLDRSDRSSRLGGVRQPRQPPAAAMRFPLALCLGLVALAAAGPSALQRRVVREVLDYVNGRSSTQLLFKEQAVEGAVEREDPSGTFVQLRVTLVQTSCRKRTQQRQNCRTLENRRKPTCLACYKFDNSSVPKVLDKYQNCGPSHQLAVKEFKHRDEAECRAVEEAGKAADALYLPGMYAFSKGLPA